MSEAAYDPTPLMVKRAEAWSAVTQTLNEYFRRSEEMYQQRATSVRALSEVPLNHSTEFAPSGKGGINSVLGEIQAKNQKEAEAAQRAAQSLGSLRNELSLLESDITKSIGDFKGYSPSFETPLTPSQTASAGDPNLQKKIDEFESAVRSASARQTPKVDPYILKVSIDRRIDSIVRKQNRLADSHAYVQDATQNVDAGVAQRLQKVVSEYAEILGQLGQTDVEASSTLLSGFVAQPALFEYRQWIQSGGDDVPKAFRGKMRSEVKRREDGSELGYAEEGSVYAQAVRAGELERRTKFLHSYQPGDYILTPQSLIEFRQNAPVWSIDLIGARLLEDHRAAADDQFVIEAKQHGSTSGRVHRWVFRAKVAANWKRDLKYITSGSIPPSLAEIAKAQASESTTGVSAIPGGSKATTNTSAPTGGASDYSESQIKDAVTDVNAGAGDDRVAGPISGAFDLKESQLTDPVSSANADSGTARAPEPVVGAFNMPASRIVNPFSDVNAEAGTAGTPGPISGNFNLNENQVTDPIVNANTGSGSARAPTSTSGAFDLKENQITDPINNAYSQPATSTASAPPTSQLGQFDLDENKIKDPVTNVYAGAGSARAPEPTSGAFDLRQSQITDSITNVNAGSGSYVGGATSLSSFDKAAPGTGTFDLTEDKLAHPREAVRPQGTDAAATHESDSEVSDVEEGYGSYFDHEEEEEDAFKDSMAYKASQDLNVFKQPVGAAAASPAAIRDQRASFTVDNSRDPSVWEYDVDHKYGVDTFKPDPGFQPAESDVPVEVERTLADTHHKYENPTFEDVTRTTSDAKDDPQSVIQRRRSSVGAKTSSGLRRKGSRKATGSYGDEDLKPLSQISSEEKRAALSGDTSALYFSQGVPDSTSGGQQH